MKRFCKTVPQGTREGCPYHDHEGDERCIRLMVGASLAGALGVGRAGGAGSLRTWVDFERDVGLIASDIQGYSTNVVDVAAVDTAGAQGIVTQGDGCKSEVARCVSGDRGNRVCAAHERDGGIWQGYRYQAGGIGD